MYLLPNSGTAVTSDHAGPITAGPGYSPGLPIPGGKSLHPQVGSNLDSGDAWPLSPQNIPLYIYNL